MQQDQSGRIRVILADDHTLVRSGIRSLLEDGGAVVVVAEAVNGREALDLFIAHRPDVIVLDIVMPDMSGIEAATEIRRADVEARIIMLSMHDSGEMVAKALNAGASGYVVKDAVPVELELAIKAVAQGGSYLSNRVLRKVMYGRSGAAVPVPSSPSQLSARELEILKPLAQGRRAKQIAYDLGVSVKTVEARRAQMMKKLSIRSLAGLVHYAVRSGLVSSNE